MITKKISRKLISQLKEIRRAATLDGATFSDAASRDATTFEDGDPTDFIKGRVMLHHTSWIIHPLDKIIKEIEAGTTK